MRIEQETSARREVVYRLLSDLFAQPATSDKISHLAKVTGEDQLGHEGLLGPLLAQIQVLSQHPDSAARDLLAEYVFLFLGAGGPQSVPPYQSPFTDAHGRVCQQPAADMEMHIRQLGMHVQDDYPEPADHIAIIFAVAAELIASGVTTARQTAFIEDHLAGWLPAFCTACTRNDRHGFYAVLARTARDFVAEDLTWLKARPIPILEEENEDV